MYYKNLLFLLLSCFISFIGTAQIYPDHFGTGNGIGVTVISSNLNSDNTATNTINGTELIPDTIGAARFLAQAVFGGNMDDIAHVTQIGIDQWLDEQMNMPYKTYATVYDDVYNGIQVRMDTSSLMYPPNEEKWSPYLTLTFFQKLFTEEDILRQKMAFALSQIFVIAYEIDGPLRNRGEGYASYYDVLYEGAFGNFEDMLRKVTLHPLMGRYLSHYANKKADPELSTQPDENFAREIMQLFTIGLHELNNDGTPKLDVECNIIPTYDIEDIQEMAKVFTGLSMGAYDTIRWRNLIGRPLSFDNPDSTGNHFVDWTVPMNMFEEHHDNNEKILPDGDTIPAGQTGLQDIDNAIDWLFKHPNVGPFISTRLIQQFVKSNPSPEYVNRVATVFNNNGNNERGDLGAVILAILTDSEARDCQWINNPQSGKLLQPLERYLNLFMALEIETPSGDFLFHDSFNPGENRYIQQAFLSSPSVFNFFSPFYVVQDSSVVANEMVSPEFQILNSVTAINYLNRIEFSIKSLANQNQPYPYKNFTGVDKNARDTLLIAQNINDKPTLQFDDYRTTYNTQGIDDLIDDLDVLLCRGQLHPNIKTLIRNNVIENLKEGNLSKTEDIVKDVIYYIMASPSYAILK